MTAALLALALAGCPAPGTDGDAGATPDASNPEPRPACSGGCAPNQVCDTVRRVCVDGCGGCPDGVCEAVDGGFACRALAITCNGVTCAPGQTACVSGQCRCVVAANGTQDSCRVAGRWCDGTTCQNPGLYEQCTSTLTTARCPAGFICDPIFGADQAVCVRDCSRADVCDRGELCANLVRGIGCLARGLFSGEQCVQNEPDGDGGFLAGDAGLVLREVPVSNTCLVRADDGRILDDAGVGTGNCTYAVFKLYEEGNSPRRTCRPPGTAGLGQRCTRDYSAPATATQCGTGLECFLSQGTEGVCLPMCNAVPPAGGFTPRPACAADEACVNLFRHSDPSNNAVVGVCVKSCDVFDPARNSCAPVAGTPTSCVPTTARGDLLVSSTGAGVCLPRRTEVKGEGEPCAVSDPFRGAACRDGQLCTSTTEEAAATCIAVCDLECAPPDGGAPAPRCAGKVNVGCAPGKACTRVTSTTGVTVGYCL